MKLTAFLLLTTSLPLMAEISFSRKAENLEVKIGGELFTEFRSDTWVPCLYPLMSPDGTHLTRQFPFAKDVAGEEKDHPHHIGFWFAHGDVNGHDFWHSGKGGKIVTKGFVGEPVLTQGDSDEASLTFTADLAWMAGDKELLAEKRSYRIGVNGTGRTIDVTCVLTATGGDVTFGDTKEGSFAIRTAPTIRLKGEVAKGGITNSTGLKDGAAWGKRAKWVAFHGPDSAGTPTVIALLDHKDNLRHPTWWHARDYGLLAANPFGPRGYKDKDFEGKGDYKLEKGESLTQRYLLILHQGDVASASIEDRWEKFSE